MRVYHTSYTIVTKPDTLHSRDALDFGRGFYVTPLLDQALQYAKRYTLTNRPAILNIYELRDNWREGHRVMTFTAYDGRWLDFISANRRRQPVEAYDIVEGGVANDRIFRTIDLYLNGDIGKEEALRRLVYEQPNYQICFLCQRAIDKCLTFLESQNL